MPKRTQAKKFSLNAPTTEVYRPANTSQIARLIAQGNEAEDWQCLLLAENFDCRCLQNCSFMGEVWLASFAAGYMEQQGLKLPYGLYHSRLHNVTIAGAVAIHHVDYLSNMAIESNVLLFRVGEISCTKTTFAHILSEDHGLKIANENAGRKVFAFAGMLSADAWIWSRNPHDERLYQQFFHFTQKKRQQFIDKGNLGFIGKGSLITHCQSINNCWIGEKAMISHSKILRDLCLSSVAAAPVKIDGASQLSNGVIADGCLFSADTKASHFVCDQNSQLAHGACLFDSYLGANSQIYGCEIRNSLIFPAHEQHHNNSFLIAATLGGQSNLAAGATLGSNHNSRAADGELQAARGFWVGLNTTLAYNSRFASFTLLSRGSYTAMNIPYPFSLLSCSQGRTEIRAAYWLQHNIYALERNSWKFRQRDQRQDPQQLYYYDYLEADTAAEMLTAIGLLQSLQNRPSKSLLKRQDVEIINVSKAIAAYRRMLIYYFVKTLYECWQETKQPLSMLLDLEGKALEWQNVGGQIMSKNRYEKILEDVRQGNLCSWDDIHQRYREISSHYSKDRYTHMQHLAGTLLGCSLTLNVWKNWSSQAHGTAAWIYETAHKKRQSDFADPFRQSCYASAAEQEAVLGPVKDDLFLIYLKEKQEKWMTNFKNLGDDLERLLGKRLNGH